LNYVKELIAVAGTVSVTFECSRSPHTTTNGRKGHSMLKEQHHYNYYTTSV